MKINVTGNAGSGKSTLSRKIANELSLPLVEMDSLIWRPGWQRTPSGISRQKLTQLLSSDNWVLDGVSRMGRQNADLIVFLDFPRRICAWRCMKRNWRYLFSSRPGLPEDCPEWKIFASVGTIIWAFPDQARPAILQDVERFGDGGIVIRTSDELTALTKDIPELLRCFPVM